MSAGLFRVRIGHDIPAKQLCIELLTSIALLECHVCLCTNDTAEKAAREAMVVLLHADNHVADNAKLSL